MVDASVAVKWFIAEPYSQSALRLRVGDNEFLAPDLLLPEVGNILWKKVRRREIAREEGEEILRAFSNAPISLHPTGPLMNIAFRIAIETGSSLYDSLYVSLALAEHCVLVTADRKLFSTFRNAPFGAKLLWVEEIA